MKGKMRRLLLYLALAMLLLAACSKEEKVEDPEPEPEHMRSSRRRGTGRRGIAITYMAPFTGVLDRRGKYSSSSTCDDKQPSTSKTAIRYK